jgi:uncharacterized protein YjbI with pentapeptide repeats
MVPDKQQWVAWLREDPTTLLQQLFKHGVPTQPLDLTGADLSNADLTMLGPAPMDLSGANLSGARANQTLIRARLAGVDVSTLHVSDATDRDAIEQVAALWRGASAWADWRAVHPLVVLSHVDLTGIDLRGYDLSKLHLMGARLDRCVADGVLFDSVYLHHASLAHANLAGATFSHCTLNRANLRGANLTRTRLLNCGLEKADLRDTMADHLEVHRGRARGLDARGATLRGAHLMLTQLDDARLDLADLTGAHAEQCAFRGATWLDANLDGTRGLPVS